MIKVFRHFVVILLLTVFASSQANAEQKLVKGNWDIHYIAFPSSFIQPEIAAQYKLQRSKYMAIVNISVLDNTDKQKAQNVSVMGKARNLIGQSQKLSFVKVEEGPAIYYLAQLKYDDEDVFNFDIEIQQGNRTETIKFNQKFYVD